MSSLELQELRQVERADVYKQGRLAATLSRTAAGVEFRYLPEWLASGGPSVASTLALQPGPVLSRAGAVPAYFAGLLPEGRRLTALRRAVKTSADDELSLLLAVGSDAVGDVQAVPVGVPPALVQPRLTISDISQVRFAGLLADLGIRPDRVALPGVQDKVSAAMLTLPATRAGARFLLKLDPPEFRHLVDNEAFFLAAARATGLATVRADVVVDADGRHGLLVERFDRPGLNADSGTHMRAVEDACQATGRPPADKYVLSTEEAFGALVGLCQAPLPAARVFLAQLAFAYVTGNGDAHAKNFSVLQTADGEWRPAPAYDLPSSQPYGDSTMAMSIGGRTSGDLGAEDFLELGRGLGVPERAVRKLLSQVVDGSRMWRDNLDQLPFDVGQIRKLGHVIDYRVRRLAP
ncbi:MAG: type II toxin-antitoxin system HipA family toxin [Mycobacteriales bacterium]